MKNIIFLSFLFSFSLQAQTNLEDSCLQATFDQDIYNHQDPKIVFETLNSKNIEEDVKTYVENPRIAGWKPWFRMKVPHLHPRTLGFYESIYFIHKYYNWEKELTSEPNIWIEKAIEFFSPRGLERVLATPIPSEETISPYHLKFKLLESRTQDETGLNDMLSKNPEMIKSACLGIHPLQLKKCKEAFKYAYKNLYDSGNTYHLGNGWLSDFVLTNKAAEGGFKLVHRMLQRIKYKDLDGNIFEDAYTSFENKQDADTFIFLSLVHGQITWESFKLADAIQPYNHATINSAYMMSILSALLDSMKANYLPEKQIYTLPADVKNVCDNGKPYHYIVPWFMSQKLIESNYGKQISSRLSFYFDWTYQMFSKSFGRSLLTNVNEPFDSPTNFSHRNDLAYSAIASFKGSHYPENDHIDFQKLVQDSANRVPQYYRQEFYFTEHDLKDSRMMAKISNIFLMRINIEQYFRELKN